MKKLSVSIFAFATVVGAAGAASADECAADEDCPIGFVCEEISWGMCPGMPPCPEGEDCPEPPPCEEGSEFVCNPSPIECESDEDCPSGLDCATFTYESCSGGTEPMPVPSPDEPGSGGSGGDSGSGSDGDPDREDDPDGSAPDDFECETVTEAFCAPPYIGGCEIDADCGDNFNCVEAEMCACSGGGGSTPGVPTDPSPDGEGHGRDDGEDSSGSDGGDGEPEEGPDGWEEDCECTGSGDFYCEPIEVECSTDDDCPAEWSCEDYGDSATICYEGEDGEVICEEPAVESPSYCAPPGWEAWGGLYGGDGAPTASGGFGEGTEESPRASTDSDLGGASGGSDPVSVPSTRTEPGEGCTSAAGGAAPAWPLALAALAFIRRRRR